MGVGRLCLTRVACNQIYFQVPYRENNDALGRHFWIMERERVLEELQRRVTGAGGRLTHTVKALAQELQLPTDSLYYLIHSFVKNGDLVTVSHGPRGTEFRLGNGRRAAGRAVGAVTRHRAPAGKGSGFCPWCGRAVQAEWRYCAACGETQPQGR